MASIASYAAEACALLSRTGPELGAGLALAPVPGETVFNCSYGEDKDKDKDEDKDEDDNKDEDKDKNNKYDGTIIDKNLQEEDIKDIEEKEAITNKKSINEKQHKIQLAELLAKNFEMRRQLYGDGVVGARNVAVAEALKEGEGWCWCWCWC